MVSPADVKEHMTVVGSDGENVGTVDRCENGQIKLTKDGSGKHRFVSMDSVDRVDGNQVRLKDKASSATRDSDRASG
jgi:hypothetical protein